MQWLIHSRVVGVAIVFQPLQTVKQLNEKMTMVFTVYSLWMKLLISHRHWHGDVTATQKMAIRPCNWPATESKSMRQSVISSPSFIWSRPGFTVVFLCCRSIRCPWSLSHYQRSSNNLLTLTTVSSSPTPQSLSSVFVDKRIRRCWPGCISDTCEVNLKVFWNNKPRACFIFSLFQIGLTYREWLGCFFLFQSRKAGLLTLILPSGVQLDPSNYW